MRKRVISMLLAATMLLSSLNVNIVTASTVDENVENSFADNNIETEVTTETEEKITVEETEVESKEDVVTEEKKEIENTGETAEEEKEEIERREDVAVEEEHEINKQEELEEIVQEKTKTAAPDTVTNLQASCLSDGRIKLNWNASKGAEGYIIYRQTGSETKMTYRYITSNTTYVDSTAEKDTYTFYRVYPYVKDENGKMILGSSEKYVYLMARYIPTAVKNLKSTLLPEGKIKISWDVSEGAEGYIIYRQTGSETKMTYRYITSNAVYIDSAAERDSYTYYRVYPYVTDKYGKRHIGVSEKYIYTMANYIPSPVQNLKINLLAEGKVKLNWNASKGAEGYIVYRQTGSETKMTYFCMTSNTEYIDNTAKKGNYTYYRVYPYATDKNGKRYLGTSEKYVYTMVQYLPDAVRNLKSETLTAGKIKVSWDASEGAEGYIVYRKTGTEEKMTYRWTTNETSFIDDTPIKDSFTFYCIYPYITDENGKKCTGPSEGYTYIKAFYYPEEVKNLRGGIVNDTQVKIMWDAPEGADGYEIQRTVEGDSKISYLSTVTATEYVDTNPVLGVNNTYKVYPFTYDKDGYKFFGTCTLEVNIKIDGAEAKLKKHAEAVYGEVGKNLKSCFDWVVKNMTYERYNGHLVPPEGYTRCQWYATKAFENHKGNCYCYAGAFYYLAKYLGYDAEYVEGQVTKRGGGFTPHGWVVIDGKYICDPEGQAEISPYLNFYMQPIGNTVLTYIR